jgi:hypothetical protein
MPMVFIGYFEGTKAYRLHDPDIKHVHTSLIVIIDENRGWKWTSGGSVNEPVAQREFVVKFYITRALEFNEDEGTPQGNRMCYRQCMFCSQTCEFTMPLYDDDDQLDALHNESPIRYCHINDSEAVPG